MATRGDAAAHSAKSEQSTPFTFAHLSDPHLTSLTSVRWRDLRNKRVLGYLSWLRKRRLEHRPEVLDLLKKDLQQNCPDHILITGDLTHIGLPEEFRQAGRWLATVAKSPTDLTVIPGNHDAYASSRWSDSFSLWLPYMEADQPASLPETLGQCFPSLRRRGSVAFIGLSSACPTAPFLATGTIGRSQLDHLDRLLEQTAKENCFRVIHLHHPVISGSEKWRKRLTDAAAVEEVLRHRGAELILHGHTHQWKLGTLETRASPIPVLSVPSASAAGRQGNHPAGYALFEVDRNREEWQLKVTRRSLMPGTEIFSERNSICLP